MLSSFRCPINAIAVALDIESVRLRFGLHFPIAQEHQLAGKRRAAI